MGNSISNEELDKKKQDFFDYHVAQYRNIRDLEINAKDEYESDSYSSYKWDEDSGVTPRNHESKTRLVRSKDSIVSEAKENYGHRLQKYSSFLTIGLDKIANVCSAHNISVTAMVAIPLGLVASLATGDSSFTTLGVSALATMGVLNIAAGKISNQIVDGNIKEIVTKMADEYASQIQDDFNHDKPSTEIVNTKPSNDINKVNKTIVPSAQSIKDKMISLRGSSENLNIKPLPTV